jgi:hypothetical protein
MGNWNVPEVCMWLDKNAAGSYVKGFMNKDINGMHLENLNVLLMIECGVILALEQVMTVLHFSPVGIDFDFQARLTRLMQSEKALRLVGSEEFATDCGADFTEVSVDNSQQMAAASSSFKPESHSDRDILISVDEDDDSQL